MTHAGKEGQQRQMENVHFRSSEFRMIIKIHQTNLLVSSSDCFFGFASVSLSIKLMQKEGRRRNCQKLCYAIVAMQEVRVKS